MLLSILGFWQAYQALAGRPLARRWLVAVALVLGVVSVLSSTLIAVSINDARLQILRFLLSSG
jgi:hypothetical protein